MCLTVAQFTALIDYQSPIKNGKELSSASFPNGAARWSINNWM